MTTNEAWWRRPETSAAVPPQRQADPPAAKASVPAARQGGGDGDLDDRSIGEVIDKAIGEIDARLAKLRDQVQEKRAEITDLEHEIKELEKNQAKAFKEMLSSNPMIRRMLAPKNKSRPRTRRKRADKPDDAPTAADAPGTTGMPDAPDAPDATF